MELDKFIEELRDVVVHNSKGIHSVFHERCSTPVRTCREEVLALIKVGIGAGPR